MDRNRIAGTTERVRGSVGEATGEITGEARVQAEGAAEPIAGWAENGLAEVKDSVRDVAKRG